MFALGVLFVFLAIRYFSDADALLAAFAAAWLPGVLAALAALVMSLVVAAFRWCSVLEAMGYSVRMGQALEILLSTWPFSIIAPSRANDFLRVQALRGRVPPFATVGSVLAERAVDVQVLFWLAFVGAFVAGEFALATAALAGALAELVIIVVLLRVGTWVTRWQVLKRYENQIAQLGSAFAALRNTPARLGAVVGASVGVWLLNTAILYALTLAFAADVRWNEVLALWPLALFVGLLPVSLGGLGTRDAAFLLLLYGFTNHEFSEHGVLAATLAYAFVTTWLLAMVGVPFAIRWLRTKHHGSV